MHVVVTSSLHPGRRLGFTVEAAIEYLDAMSNPALRYEDIMSVYDELHVGAEMIEIPVMATASIHEPPVEVEGMIVFGASSLHDLLAKPKPVFDGGAFDRLNARRKH